MTTSRQDQRTWTNWAGNQEFAAGEIAEPTTAAELIGQAAGSGVVAVVLKVGAIAALCARCRKRTDARR